MSVNNIFDGKADGANFGRSAGKIGFYGLAAPIVKATLTNAVVAGSSVANVQRGLVEINNALQNLGLITTV